MTQLSNVSLRKRLVESFSSGEPLVSGIRYPSNKQIQPASIDVYINPEDMWVWEGWVLHYDNPERDASKWKPLLPYTVDDGRKVVMLKPGLFYRMSTLEYFRIPLDLCGYLHGVSTMARLGFSPHEQAGLLDPGWEGVITGEVTVSVYLELTFEWPGNPDFEPPRLGQVTFHQLTEEASPGYQGRYQGDTKSEPAKLITSYTR